MSPLLVRSEISFFLIAIEANAGFINNASLALKYVSSLFDSNASLGRLIETDSKFIDSGPTDFAEPLLTPELEVCPFANTTFPPSEIISATASEISDTFPLS